MVHLDREIKGQKGRIHCRQSPLRHLNEGSNSVKYLPSAGETFLVSGKKNVFLLKSGKLTAQRGHFLAEFL